MRRGEKAVIEQRLRDLSATTVAIADQLRDSKEGPPHRFSVGWGNSPQAIISIDDRETYRHDVETLVDDAISALFESCRDPSDPRDPSAFARVMDRVIAEAKKRCHQHDAAPSGCATMATNAG